MRVEDVPDLRKPSLEDLYAFGSRGVWLGQLVGIVVLAAGALFVHHFVVDADRWGPWTLFAISAVTIACGMTVQAIRLRAYGGRKLRQRRARAAAAQALAGQDAMRALAERDGWTVANGAAFELEGERARVERTGELGTLDYGLVLSRLEDGARLVVVEFWRQDGEEGPVLRAFLDELTVRRPGRLSMEALRAVVAELRENLSGRS